MADLDPDWTDLVDPIIVRALGASHPKVKELFETAKKIERDAESAARRGEFRTALTLLGRNPAVRFFAHWRTAGLVSDAALRDNLLSVWSLAEYPCRYLPRRTWLDWFKVTGFLSDAGADRPSAKVEVWRAQVGRVWGLSWTRDRDKAKWFAERNAGRAARIGHARGQLLHGFAPPDSILATIDSATSRGEAEVIVEPVLMRKLGKVTRDL